MKKLRLIFLFLTVFIPFFALFFAIYSQLYWGAKPCAWCIIQRIFFVLVLFFGLLLCIFSFLDYKKTSKILEIFGLISSFFGIISCIYHIKSVSSSENCFISPANKFLIDMDLDRFSKLFFQVKANCSDSSFQILGFNMEIASIAGFFFCFFLFSFLSVDRILSKNNLIKA